MKERRVVYDSRANQDLRRIFFWIAETTSVTAAERIVLRIEEAIAGFDIASERGSRHDDIAPGMRTASVDDRATIAFRVYKDEVVILRVFYGGENYLAQLRRGYRKPRT